MTTTDAPAAEKAAAGKPAGETALPGLGRAAAAGRRSRRARGASAVRRELEKRFGTSRPIQEAPLGFKFSLDVSEPVAPGPRQLIGRSVLVRPYVREIFALGIAAAEGSSRGERSFQIPGSDRRNVQSVLDLIPSEITYTAGAWEAENKRSSTRRGKLETVLGKLSCPAPDVHTVEHPDEGALARMAVVLSANESQGLFCKVLTRPGCWLDEASPLNAWPDDAIRPPEALLPHEAVTLANEIREAEIEIDDPDSILEPLEALVRSHLVVRSVPGLPGLAEVVHGVSEGWPAASTREISAEEARREVARAREAEVSVVLDPEVADVLRMAAARPALDGDLLPPQRIPVARQRATERGMTNFSQVGTGKSAMTLIACRGKAAELEAYRMCLVMSRALVSEWIEELIPKHWPGVAVHLLDGAQFANGLIRFDRELGVRPGIVIATTEQVRSSVEQLRVLTYDDLVIEEADECLANPGTQIARALWRLRDRAKVAIPQTATPRGKSNEELDAIEAYARNNREALRTKPLARRFNTFDDMSMRRFRRAMGPTMVRVTRAEMKKYMPDVEAPEFKFLEPSRPERALLDAAEDRIAALFGEWREQVERASTLKPDDPELAELRQRMASTKGFLLSATEIALLAASDAEALRASNAIAAGLLESDGLIDAVVKAKPTKRTVVAGTLAAAEADDEQTLVFSESVELLRLLSRELDDTHGVEAPLYIGGMKDRETSALRRAFRRREIRTLLLSPVGRRGLNLPASLTAHYDLPWTPRPLEQREGRAPRTGSPYSSVGVLMVVMKNTPEEHRAELLIPRAAETDGVLDQGEDAGTGLDGGSQGLSRQLSGLASSLADRPGASTKLKVAARIFAARQAAAA